MRTAVTGASGYLGRNYMKMYQGTCDFVALSRNTGVAERIDGAEYRETDYSLESLREIFRGCDSVVHLAYAMATKENEEGGIDSYKSSMTATENVLRAACELGIRNVVFASSRLVYPSYSEKPFTEDDEPAPTTSYGRSKVMMEDLCREYIDRGVSVKALRFGQIIGSGMKVRGLFFIFVENALKNAPLTLIGSDVRDYLYVKDACRSIAAALSHPEASGIYNISMGKGTDNRIMADAVIKASGSSSEIIVKEPAVPKKPDRIVLSVEKARRDLGFECAYPTVYEIAEDVIKQGK